MNTPLTVLAAAAVLTWLTLLVASLVRARCWTPQGLLLAFGNRDNLPPATSLAGRAQRCATNTLENFVLFAALLLAAQMKAGDAAQAAQLLLGAKLFFWARLAYIPIYYAGITYLRTAVYFVGVAGLGMILATLV